MIRTDIAVMLTTLLLSIWLWYLYELYQAWGWKPSRKKLLRLLRFCTPHDCPYCGGQHLGRCARVVASKPLPIPWSQVKSPRGRKKRVKTDGHACPNGECGYYGIRNSKIHALIGYGHHGKGERIQDFFCQACQKKVTSRWGTIMYRLKTTTKRVSEVMTALAEGLDLSAAVRVFGHGEGTMRCWLTRSGEHSRRLHDEQLRGLRLGHAQLYIRADWTGFPPSESS
jgi:transposase-like protein